jgi:hypothetical protein
MAATVAGNGSCLRSLLARSPVERHISREVTNLDRENRLSPVWFKGDHYQSEVLFPQLKDHSSRSGTRLGAQLHPGTLSEREWPRTAVVGQTT